MNLDQAPIPHGVESPFIYVVKPNTYSCHYCFSRNTFIDFRGIYKTYYKCIDCNMPFTINKQ